MSEYALETHSLTKVFGRKAAVRDLTLSVPKGGIHAVVGSNGAGKTTLFRILLGLTSPTLGSSRVLGFDSQSLSHSIRGRIGLVNEEHTLPGWMSMASLFAMHRSLYSRWQDEIFQEVVCHFDILPKQRVSQLSRGERAGLNLALALAQDPELLILDEPTLGLDVVARQVFLDSLRVAAKDRGCTVLYCSHRMDEIEEVAERLIVLERGHLSSDSTLDRFMSRMECWKLPPSFSLDVTRVSACLQHKKYQDHHQVVLLDPSDLLREEWAAVGDTQKVSMTFERAVNAFLERNHSKGVSSHVASV